MLRLHVLTECEAGVELLGTARAGDREALLRRHDWGARLALLSPALEGRAPLLAVRRVLFDLCGLRNLVTRAHHQARPGLCIEALSGHVPHTRSFIDNMGVPLRVVRHHLFLHT